MVSTRKNDLSC